MHLKRSILSTYGRRAGLPALFLLVIILMVWIAPLPVGAAPVEQAGQVQVLQSTAKVAYRVGVDFRISAVVNGGGEITKARLKVKFGKRGREEIYDVNLSKGAGSYSLSDEADSLATGMSLIYSWTLGDGRVQAQTEAQTVVYEDTRATWYQREGPQVTVRWYNGDGGYGSLMYQLAADTLATYKRRFNFDPTDQIYITIYGSSTAYHSAFPEVPSWSGGFSRYGGVEIVAIAPQDYNSSIFIGEGIPHELSHAALYQFLRGSSPLWLNEGLAVYNQNVIDIKEYDDLVRRAYQTNSLIPLSKLNNRWPSDSESARLAYAQGRSIVTFLINAYGNEVWSNLLDQLRRNDMDGAMKAVFGVDMTQMEDLWKTKVLAGGQATMPQARLRGPVPSQPTEADMKAKSVGGQKKDSGNDWWVIALVGLVGVLALVSVATLVVVRRKKKSERYGEAEDDHSAAYLEAINRAHLVATNPFATAPASFVSSGYYNAASNSVSNSVSNSNPAHLSAVPPPMAPRRIPLKPETVGWNVAPPALVNNQSEWGATVPPPVVSDDPFDHIASRFGSPGSRPGFVTRPAEPSSASFLDIDPYGLNLNLTDKDTKNNGK